MKNILYVILLVAGIAVCPSCNDWLDVLPENEQVSDEYWTSKEEVESVLGSGYVYLRQATTNLIVWGELRGSCIYSTTYSDNNDYYLQTFQPQPTQKAISSWAPLYKVINMANSVLANAEAVLAYDATFEEAVMLSYKAEAYFLRALSYFYIVRNWRDAPLILRPYETDENNYEVAKSPESELIALIKADIKAALATGAAKERYEADWATKGRATKWALYALLADVCLWNEEYNDAIIACNEILNATSSFRPVLISDASKWYEIYFPGNSNESIFEINWNQGTYTQTNNLAILFGNSTPRWRYSDKMFEDFVSETFETGIDNAVRTLYGGYVPMSVTATLITGPCYVWKYSGIGMQDQVRNTTNQQDPNFIIYRVADIILMKAEALILSGQDKWQAAVDLINQIRVRSNLAEIEPQLDETDEADMLTYVLYERKMELAAEGKRWYDVLRLGKRNNFQYRDRFLIEEVVEYNKSANASWIRSVLRDNNGLYLPVHTDEIENNRLLEQNPYYE